jgi:BTB/POZ domain-containing protein KCTD9
VTVGYQQVEQPMTQPRLGYEDSIRRLRELGFLGADEQPVMPDQVPQPEDEEALGLGFYKTIVGEGADLSNLTLSRSFFGRSEIGNASFRNTDLSESNLRWNDFIDVDFSEATLTRADLRASNYTRVNFTRANLCGADLRRADFEDCVFDSAAMDGTVLTRKQGSRLPLSSVQKAAIAWCDDDGEEPSGG